MAVVQVKLNFLYLLYECIVFKESEIAQAIFIHNEILKQNSNWTPFGPLPFVLCAFSL